MATRHKSCNMDSENDKDESGPEDNNDDNDEQSEEKKTNTGKRGRPKNDDDYNDDNDDDDEDETLLLGNTPEQEIKRAKLHRTFATIRIPSKSYPPTKKTVDSSVFDKQKSPSCKPNFKKHFKGYCDEFRVKYKVKERYILKRDNLNIFDSFRLLDTETAPVQYKMIKDTFNYIPVPPQFNPVIEYCWTQILNEQGVQYHIVLLEIVMQITKKNNHRTFVDYDYCVLREFMRLAVTKWLILKDEHVHNFNRAEAWLRIGQFVAGRDDIVGFFSRIIISIETYINNDEEEMRRRSL